MTPELLELAERGKKLLRRGWEAALIRRDGYCEMSIGDVRIKRDHGAWSIWVYHGGTSHLAYCETPSAGYVAPPPERACKPVVVRHGLTILRQHMVLDDLACI